MASVSDFFISLRTLIDILAMKMTGKIITNASIQIVDFDGSACLTNAR